MDELERLWKNSQMENERLCQELKKKEMMYKETEKRMFEKNEALASELAILK